MNVGNFYVPFYLFKSEEKQQFEGFMVYSHLSGMKRLESDRGVFT